MNRMAKVLLIAAVTSQLGGCAAGKLLMAGYTPPQTIADLLREQGKLGTGQGELSAERGMLNGTRSTRGGGISLDDYKGQVSNNGHNGTESAMTAPPGGQYLQPWANSDTGFRPTFSHKSLQDYASQLSMQLIQNSVGLRQQDLIGVASFVMLDKSLKNTNVLGNQLSEYFISEIQQFGMSVVDFKVRNTVHISQSGDFVFSRDALDLANDMHMDHVLSGTLIEKATGVQINARIIALNNKRVVASASLLVPHFVADGLSRAYVSEGE